jgi:hypothetical protein
MIFHALLLVTDVRTEAVMQALALNKKQSMVPMPSKRKSGVYGQNKQSNRVEHGTGLFTFNLLSACKANLNVQLACAD